MISMVRDGWKIISLLVLLCALSSCILIVRETDNPIYFDLQGEHFSYSAFGFDPKYVVYWREGQNIEFTIRVRAASAAEGALTRVRFNMELRGSASFAVKYSGVYINQLWPVLMKQDEISQGYIEVRIVSEDGKYAFNDVIKVEKYKSN
jgi:hypothetical protein